MSWDPLRLPDLRDRTYAVTGATAGIGYFAAEQLAGAGAHVVLLGRNPAKLSAAQASLAAHARAGTSSTIVLDLADLEDVRRGADQLAAVDRLDAILLNGGSMDMGRSERTVDGHPMLLATHVLANLALIAGTLPVLVASGTPERPARVVHTSTGYVRRFPTRPDDVASAPRVAIAAYTKAKALTEVVAVELDRRLRAAGTPVLSLLSRPGVGVDAKTPRRAGIHDESTRRRRNPYTLWAQGKDTAAWSAVRALTDPSARGGEYFAPEGAFRGAPVVDREPTAAAALSETESARIWDELSRLAGLRVPV
jgi:NAD(P)-dependent dehydrogenase (short-subunit alcohol dehydrogenase family)